MSYMPLLFGMVDIETVLILGAGASKAFGFPTGEELVKEIYTILDKEKGGYFQQFFDIAGNFYSPALANKFPSVLKQANPPSIDSWLEHNPSFIEVGKVAIAITLLLYEHHSGLTPNNNWYQLLSKRLDGPFEKFQDNKLSIITFNYDRSLEQYLFGTFRYTHTERTEEECKEKLNQLRMLHVYGSLGRLEWQFDKQLPLVSYGQSLNIDTIISASKGIKIIPSKKPQEVFNVVQKSISDEFNEAQKLIAAAKAVYFLGFGYNQTNMERLGIELRRRDIKKMGTAKGLGYQETQEVNRMGIFQKAQKTVTGKTISWQIVDDRIENFLLDKTVYEFLHDYVDFNSL